MENTERKETNGNTPLETFQFGRVQTAVWCDEGDFGPRYSAKFAVRFKDGEKWKDRKGFDVKDFLDLAQAAERAYSIVQEDKAIRRRSAE